MNYGDRISLLREKHQLTQGELAKITCITRAALSHYENNRRQPDYETLKVIADYFHVTLDYLMWGIVKEPDERSQEKAVAKSGDEA